VRRTSSVRRTFFVQHQRQVDFVLLRGRCAPLPQVIPGGHQGKGLRPLRYVVTVHDDGVSPIGCIGDDEPFHVVAGVPFPIAQALAGGVEPLVAVIVRAVGGDDFQVQVVDQGLGRRRFARVVGPGQGDAEGTAGGRWSGSRGRGWGCRRLTASANLPAHVVNHHVLRVADAADVEAQTGVLPGDAAQLGGGEGVAVLLPLETGCGQRGQMDQDVVAAGIGDVYVYGEGAVAQGLIPEGERG